MATTGNAGVDERSASVVIDGQVAPLCDLLLLPLATGNGGMVQFDATDHLVISGCRGRRWCG